VTRRRRIDLALLLIVRRAERNAQRHGRRRDHQPDAAGALDRKDHPNTAPSQQPPPPATDQADT
jgi:hypothetical protein